MEIGLSSCNINDTILLSIVEVIRGHSSLKKLNLAQNRISSDGCTALVTLLEHSNCNIEHLYLYNNQIPIHQNTEEPFSNVLCNTTSINSVYSSNHTLESLSLYRREGVGSELQALLKMNKTKNKRQIAIRKVLKYHPNMDMEPYFADWISDYEQTLKGLPYVLALFEKANESYDGGPKKLSAIYQFTRAMPLSFAATPFVIESERKRKRGWDYLGKGYKFDKS